jgi:hypothetical protein
MIRYALTMISRMEIIVKLRHHAANFRKPTQALRVVNQESAKTQGLVGIVD